MFVYSYVIRFLSKCQRQAGDLFRAEVLLLLIIGSLLQCLVLASE